MNARKRIAFVIESLDCGGAEKSLVTLLQNLDYNQLEVDLLLLKAGGAFDKMVPAEVSVKYITVDTSTKGASFLWRRMRYFLSRKYGARQRHLAQKFWQAFKNGIPSWQESYDVAISYSQGFSTYYVADKMSARRKYAWLNTDYVKAGYDPQVDWPYYNVYNKVVVVSEEGGAVFTEAMQRVAATAPETIIVKDISDRNVIRMQSSETIEEVFDKSLTNIVTVCRLEPPKGLHLAIEACKQLLNKGHKVHWYIIGEGSERARLEQLIRENGLQDHFSLLGFRENPYPYMARADVYVQTSLYEGWGLTLIEATLLQKPVVTTNFPTAYQIVQDAINGYITEMNAKDIASKIEYLIEHPATAAVMSSVKNELSEINKKKSLDTVYQLLYDNTRL